MQNVYHVTHTCIYDVSRHAVDPASLNRPFDLHLSFPTRGKIYFIILLDFDAFFYHFWQDSLLV